MKAIFATDLHGEDRYYQDLCDLALAENADAVLLGGDLFPSHRPDSQVSYYRGVIVPFLNRLREVGISIFTIMGNNDCRSIMRDVISDDLLRIIHLKGVKLGKFTIVGYPYVPVTPFSLKDWERWDTSSSMNADIRLEGYITYPEFKSIALDPQDRSMTIEKDMTRLAGISNPSRTIYLFHAPPFGTALDLAGRGHVGSRAIRGFIEAKQPPLTLHGHIHESPYVSSKWHDSIGNTLCINPGQGRAKLHAVIMDLDQGTLGHTVLHGHPRFRIR